MVDIISPAKDVIFKIFGSLVGRLTFSLNAQASESYFYTPDRMVIDIQASNWRVDTAIVFSSYPFECFPHIPWLFTK